MKASKMICALLLAGIMTAASAASVFADEAKATDKYVTDPSKVTEDTDAPTFSFDMSDWKDYVKTVDGAGVTFKLSSENKSSYQGQSLKIEASSDGTVLHNDMNFNWLIWDSDNIPIYESENDPEKNYTNVGIMISAADLGLECFNASTVTFKYRIGAEAKGKIMSDTVLAAPVDADGKWLGYSKVTQLTVNEAEADNVNKYANGIVSIPDLSEENNVPAENLLIMIPVDSQMSNTAVLYIDNLVVKLQSGAQIANLDGYNKSATPKNDNELKVEIQAERNDVKLDENDVPLKSKVKSVVVVIGLVLLGLGVLVGIVFATIKLKKRFY